MPNPFFVLPDSGKPLPTPGGGKLVTMADAATTDGAMSVFDLVIQPKAGPGLHVHSREDEMWYVLEGDFRSKAGGVIMTAPPGALVFGPRLTPHNFQNIGDTPGRLLVMCTPAGVEGFFEHCAEHLPGVIDPEVLAAIAAASGVDFVGPPLAITDPL